MEKLAPLDSLLPTLNKIGAVFVESSDFVVDTRFGKANSETRIYSWRNRLLRLKYNVEDGLNIEVSNEGPSSKDDATFRDLYSYTIPGFDNFTQEQHFDRIISESRTGFMEVASSHLLKLNTLNI